MDKKTKKQKIGKSILLMLLCILINFLGKYAAASLQLPVWLDVVGTCVAAYFLGPFGGVIAGVTNNLFFGVLNPAAVAYMLTSVAVGLLFGYCAKKGYLENFTKCMVSSFLVGVFSVVVSTPLNLLFYQGKCGNVWGDALFDMLDWYGMPRWLCSVAGEAVVDIIDKQLCVALAFFIIRGIQRGRKRLFKGASEAALFLAVVAAPFCVPAVFAGAFVSQESPEFFDCHIGTVYDSRSGMPSSEANIIAETEDGYIWIGSYAGLTRYDGTDFEFIREGGITSITSMMTDRQGRLWVGTNDGGIARYESGVPTFFTVQDGLPANSIRTFAEDADGTVYVGTTDRICRIEADDTVHVLEQEVEYVTSLTVYDGALLGVTNLGELFCIRDGELLRMPKAGQGNVYHTCISVTEQGILAGTSADYVEKLRITDEGIVAEKQISTGELSRIADIGSDSQGRTWLCAENGFGYLDAEGRLQTKHYEGFDRSMECVHEDYEGNIWIASSRYGVMKFSENQFTDLFSVVGAEAAVTNAVVHYNGAYYCGTDNGLVILDETGKQEVRNELTRLLEKERVRSLMVDSADRLWICTYGGAGLVRYTADGSITVFGEADGTTGTRFRCIEELSDGTIAVGTSAGITFICGDTVTGTVTTEDGLGNSQILCLLEGDDGTLYAGSDGAGLYALKDQKIVENYTVADGLTSDVILRIAAYKQGFFIVASNSLCYMDESGIEPLRHFPYFNNYDIILDGGKAYVLSSAGIYVTEAEALRTGQRFCYKLYNNSDGLFGALTANSWNCIEPDGRLLLCCNNG
ncbi:MAG: two-component regulator propeller domain-containing protein, partial [Lachnospiraceae bacterium]